MTGNEEGKMQSEVTETEATRLQQKHDWEKVRSEYIQDEARPSLRELGIKYGICFHNMGKRSKEENWVEKRAKYWREIEEELREKAKQAAIKTRLERINIVQGCIHKIVQQIKNNEIKGTFRDLELLIRLEADLAGDPIGSQKELKTRVRILWAMNPMNQRRY